MAIQENDILSGRPLVMSFPNNTEFEEGITIFSSDKYFVDVTNDNDVIIIAMRDAEDTVLATFYAYNTDTQTTVTNLTSYTLPDDFGIVSSIDTGSDAYQYITAIMGTPIASDTLDMSTYGQAAKVATNYMTWSSQYGLVISEDATENPEEMTGGSTRVTYDGVEMYKGQTRVAKFGETSVIGDEDSAHVYLDPDTFNVTNDTGAQFFSVDMNGESERLSFDKKVTSVIGVSATASVTISDSPELDFIEDGVNIVVTIASVGGSYADNAGWGAIKGTAKTEAYTSQSGIVFTLAYDGEHTFTVSWNNTVERTVLLRVRESLNMNTPSFTFGTRSDTKGSFSSTFGEGLSASHANQVVIGRYNEDSDNAAFIIGNGVSDPNILSNALTVDWEGNLECNNLPAMMECGQITVSNVASHSYADYQVTFTKTFSSAPIVVVGMQTASTGYGTGSVSVSAHSITATGFTARIFNNDSSARSPYIHWIAMLA